MSKVRRLALLVLYVATVLAVITFWRQPYFLLFIQTVLAGLLNWLYEWRLVRVFVLCATLGVVTEIILIQSGAWQYNSHQAFGVPVWLPVLWGSAALFFMGIERIISKDVTNKNATI